MIPQQNFPPHLNSQSLRRSRSRPSPSSSALGGVTGGHYQTPTGIPGKPLIQENPYQQPYLGRSAGLSDSPTSDNASDATLTDSELPISNQNALPLQNGGLLMGGNLDFSTASGKLNSLKRNINSNGRSTTGIGPVSHTHSGNHDNLTNQFVMHTSGGKIYIPQDPPKNSTSDYKSSPGGSPTKKISSSLLYKDAANIGSLRDGRSISKSDDDDFMYKVKRFCCTCNKSLAMVLIALLCISFVVNILFLLGAIPWESESAKCCMDGVKGIDERNRDLRQSSKAISNGTYGGRSDKSIASTGDVEWAVDEKKKSPKEEKSHLHVLLLLARGLGDGIGGRNRLKRSAAAHHDPMLDDKSSSNDSGDGGDGSSSSTTSSSSSSSSEPLDLHLHATQDGVNEMVTTSTKPITEGIEEVDEYPEPISLRSHHTLSLEQKVRADEDFHKIRRREDGETEEEEFQVETTTMDLRQTERMVVKADADDDTEPQLKKKLSNSENQQEEEIADDSSPGNIFDNLIQVVSQTGGTQEENPSSPSLLLMNVEETTRNMRTSTTQGTHGPITIPPTLPVNSDKIIISSVGSNILDSYPQHEQKGLEMRLMSSSSSSQNTMTVSSSEVVEPPEREKETTMRTTDVQEAESITNIMETGATLKDVPSSTIIPPLNPRIDPSSRVDERLMVFNTEPTTTAGYVQELTQPDDSSSASPQEEAEEEMKENPVHLLHQTRIRQDRLSAARHNDTIKAHRKYMLVNSTTTASKGVRADTNDDGEKDQSTSEMLADEPLLLPPFVSGDLKNNSPANHHRYYNNNDDFNRRHSRKSNPSISFVAAPEEALSSIEGEVMREVDKSGAQYSLFPSLDGGGQNTNNNNNIPHGSMGATKISVRGQKSLSSFQTETPADSQVFSPVNNYPISPPPPPPHASVVQIPPDSSPTSQALRNENIKSEDSQPSISISYDHLQRKEKEEELGTRLEIVSIQQPRQQNHHHHPLYHRMGSEITTELPPGGAHSPPPPPPPSPPPPPPMPPETGKLFPPSSPPPLADDLQLRQDEEENNVIKPELDMRSSLQYVDELRRLTFGVVAAAAARTRTGDEDPSLHENNQIDDSLLFPSRSSSRNLKPFHYHGQPRTEFNEGKKAGGKARGNFSLPSSSSPSSSQQKLNGSRVQSRSNQHPATNKTLGNNRTQSVLTKPAVTILPSSLFSPLIHQDGSLAFTTTTRTITTSESERHFGGVCQCFCPCLETGNDDDGDDYTRTVSNEGSGGRPEPFDATTLDTISFQSSYDSSLLPSKSSSSGSPLSTTMEGQEQGQIRNEFGLGGEEKPEDEEFIVVSMDQKGVEDNKSNFESVTDEWLQFSGSGSGSLDSGRDDKSFPIPVTDSPLYSSLFTSEPEDQYYSSHPLTRETITMQYEREDNNGVSEQASTTTYSPRLHSSPPPPPTTTSRESLLSEDSVQTPPTTKTATDMLLDESTLSSRDSLFFGITGSARRELMEEQDGDESDEEDQDEEDWYDDNETMSPIVKVSTKATGMRSTEAAADDYNRENSLVDSLNGIRKEGEEEEKAEETSEGPDEVFEWVQCSCTTTLQVGKNYYKKVDPGVRTFPAVNFPPDGTSFAQITLGSRLSNIIGPYSYWNMQFYQSEGAYVTWELSVPRGASVGFYARRNALPTHTHYDFMEILRGFKTRSKRSSPPTVTKEISKFIEQGHWFLSLYNDDSDPQEVIFSSSISEEMTEGCPNGCSGNGQCQSGHCQCSGGFGGEDCSQSICPVLCSGRGEYLNGECQCNPGWKGKECNLRHDECEVPDCNGHGKCVNGKCSCVRGYKGEFCQEADCVHPTCSGHGFCLAGTCMCKKGWRGADCSQPDNEALQCLPDCSSHGVFNLETQTCSCEPRWTGEDCSQELCDTNCGAHGICIGGGCQCSEGWTGPLCNQRVCDKRCADHGQCKNGTCLCVTGWNGRHCTLEGCPNSCSGHGQCKANHEGLWECKCHAGWTGIECSVMMELNCNDGKDNDKDGLTDCEDPECCSVTQCEKSQLCISAKKPIDILLRKQPPAITASFFEKMKFLIEEGSLQSYARQDAFNGSRSGVVRGRVVTPNGSGLMGVRVSSSSPLDPLGGFTLTQDDGWFDLMVNGGGAVTLHFGRSPFNPQTRTIFVPWNEVVIIDIVVMGSLDLDERVFVRGQSCDSHDYETMKPIVLATWKHGFQGDCPETSTILVESQVVQESIRIPGTGLHLMYHSSRVQGYLSTIQLQLTGEKIPGSLKRVHLRITIEGVLFEKIFEADPDIKYTYAWNRLNVYRQRVYGVTTAIVKVGYEYSNCASVIWEVQSTTLSGHDMSISDIGGWNLDIHHRYNFHEGIIQKGDGTNIYLKHRPRVITTTMGNGYQRSLDCLSECNGVAAKQRLLAPVALQAAPDGTVFVGDFDLIRRIMVDGTVHNVVKLNATRVSYRYHMALSPVDNTLYISDPESHQIIRVRNIEDSSDPEHNWEPAVGSGERCLPGDEAHCGDEALARDAKLAYPKGVAVSTDNVLYFADGTNIRKVDRDGIITTVIGNHQQKSHWKPIPCEGTLKVEEVHLRWPTELTVNPLDNSLYIIDDHMILKLTEDNRIRIIAGRPLHCTAPAGGYDMDLATHATLISPQSMAFASNGDLYVAESDSQRINRVRLVTTDGKISHFAGAESKCNCLDQNCPCYEEDYYLASTSKFNTISAICMTPDGVLHVADQGNNRIRSIMALIPQAQPTDSRQYEIYSPETQEIYVFNRFGQHLATKNIVTGETIYTFLYNVNMSNGKLSSVTDSAGNKVQILRDYSSQVKTIENSQAQKFNLKMSRVRMLQEFATPEGYNLTFDYHGSTGLIKSRQDSSGRSSVYSYDEFGRLTMAVSPTGQVVTLTFDLSQKGASVKVTRDDNLPEVVLIKGSSIYKRQGKTEEVTSVHPDGSVIRQFPWGQTITTETTPYNVLADINPILSDSFPIPGKQRTEVVGDLVNRVEWRYVPRKEGKGKNKQVVQIDKKMRINGENILMIEYDRDTKTEIVFTDDRSPVLNVTYDRSSRPSKWIPSVGYAPVELEYDRFGRLIAWKWDDLTEQYAYDRSGRLFKIDYTDGTSLTHTFKDLIDNLPQKVTTAGGSDYLIEYDSAGAFQSLTTPRGHIHNFGVSTSIGVYEYVYKAPSSRDVYKIQYNDLGQILAISYPQGAGRVNYVYNKYNQLEATVAGLRSTRFGYQENSGLLKVADVSQSSFEVKIEYKYHGGIIKEQREKYGSTTGLDNIHLKYQYDGNARISSIEAEINGKHVQGLTVRKSQNLGVLETIQDLTIYQNINGDNFNRTLIQDTTKVFHKVVEKDRVGRARRFHINLKGQEVFKLDIDYDSRGKIKHRKMTISKSAYADNIVYDADGHVSEVMGSGNWKYVYDENGNTIQIMEQGEKSSLIYDSGDRVIQVGELFRYTYDPRGFLVQRGSEKFQYDDKGLLLHAVKKDVYKVWFFYDHLDRLVSWKDDQGNVTQFLYANPETPHLITHIHFPFWGKHYVLLYDNSDALVGLTSSNSERYFVATDQNNSPVAVFNGQGNVVKEIHRTPFGKTVKDTNPEFYFPIGFHGGVVDRKTGLVIINGRPYDPTIGHWMVPNWKDLSANLRVPTDIFSYRFANNDPITPRNTFAQSKMTSLKDWLKLYNYDVRKIFGQDYIKPISVEPTVTDNPHLVPEFGAVSGLDCIAKTVTSGFKNIGFRRGSRLKTEKLLAGVNEWDLMSKIAYKRAAFGPGLLISRVENGRTLISNVDNSVVQGVITSVLNGSLSIDFKSSHQNTFYFVKDNPHKLRDDMEELKRLGGLYNVSVHDAENGIKELRLSNGETSVAVRYGTDRDEEFGRLIKHAHRRAIEKAWDEEKMYISMGLDGRRAWTEEEKEQLLSKGQVHGYRPSDLYNVHKFPQLADDPSNVIFQRDSRRKRRKSNKRHHDHSPIISSSSYVSLLSSLSTSSSSSLL